MYTPEHLIWDHEYHTESHVPHPKIILTHNTTTRGPRLSLHPVPRQDRINPRDPGKKIPHPYYECVTDGQMLTHEEGRLPSTPQGIPQEKPHNHALHVQRVVDTPGGRIGILSHPVRGY